MRFRYLKDGTQRERSCQFSFSSAKRFLVSLLFPFTNVLLAQPVDTTSIFPLNTGDWADENEIYAVGTVTAGYAMKGVLIHGK